jgi:hypothetical protein
MAPDLAFPSRWLSDVQFQGGIDDASVHPVVYVLPRLTN